MEDYFKNINAIDRMNLCDIAWYLKGLKQSDDNPFIGDHHETLEKLIKAIASKVNDEKRQSL